MKNKVIIHNDFALLPGAKAIATNKGSDDAAKTIPVIPKESSSDPWSPWGDDNLFPQNVLTDLEKNSIALRALEKRKTVHFGRGNGFCSWHQHKIAQNDNLVLHQ